MKNLTQFEQKVLAVLTKLQYLCDVVALYKHNTEKGIEYSFSDMFPPIKGQDELRYVVQYLNKNGLDISITFDIDNDDPSEPKFLKKYGEADNVPLGLIKGRNIETIKKIIQENISKLNPEIKVPETQTTQQGLNPNKVKQKFTSKMKIIDDYLFSGEEKIPVERGQKLLTQTFLNNAKVFQGERVFKKGNPLKIKQLREDSNYNNGRTFRDALKKLRGKLRKKKWPVSIKNVSTGKYQMEIRYNKISKTQKK